MAVLVLIDISLVCERLGSGCYQRHNFLQRFTEKFPVYDVEEDEGLIFLRKTLTLKELSRIDHTGERCEHSQNVALDIGKVKVWRCRHGVDRRL